MTSHLFKASRYEPYAAVSPSNFISEIKGKSVLITGGGSGVGSHIAHAFAEASASAIKIVGRTESRLHQTANDLQTEFPNTKVSYAVIDVDLQESIASLFANQPEHEKYDVLVNNAGYLPNRANFVDADMADFWKAFTTNVLGVATLTQLFLQHRRRVRDSESLSNNPKNDTSSTPGIVISVNSLGAYEIMPPSFAAYAASKLAAARLMELLTQDVPSSEGLFFSVHPGAVKTEMYEKSGMDGQFTVTDGRLTGQFMVWLATEQAAFLNGRFLWANWDVEELMSMRERILGEGLLRTAIKERNF
jgi:NAD(P)-dependent dehydrogenase (short-subunit alcohol dehydrogenase family)